MLSMTIAHDTEVERLLCALQNKLAAMPVSYCFFIAAVLKATCEWRRGISNSAGLPPQMANPLPLGLSG